MSLSDTRHDTAISLSTIERDSVNLAPEIRSEVDVISHDADLAAEAMIDNDGNIKNAISESAKQAFLQQRRKVKIALPALFLLTILGHVVFQSFNLVYQNVGASLHVSASTSSLLVSIPGVALAAICMLYDTLCDYISPRTIIIWGVCLLTASSIFGFVCSGNFWCVLIARILQTLAVHASVVLVIMVKYLSPKEKALYIGVNNAVYYISVALGMLFGGTISFIPWKWLLLIPALSILLLPIIARDVPRLKGQHDSFDTFGITVFVAGATALTIYFTFPNWWLLLVFAVSMIIFSFYVRFGKNPFLSREFMRNGAFMGIMVTLFVGFFFQYGAIPIYKVIGKRVYHMDLQEISIYLMIIYIACMILSFVSGPLMTRVGRYNTILISAALMVIGFALSALFLKTSFILLSIFAIVYEAGLTLIYTPIYDLTADALQVSERGRGIGVAHVMMNTAPSIGIAAYSFLMDRHELKDHAWLGIHIEGVDATRTSNMFWIMCMTAVLALIIVILLRKPIKRAEARMIRQLANSNI